MMDPTLFDYAGMALGQLVGAHLAWLLFGVLLGLMIGLLPGLGGISGMSLLLPFVYGMDQQAALAMMIGLTSVTTTSDTFPSVLMGVPGSSGSQATVLDGFPMAKRGEAARALSAAFAASLAGGVFGAVLLSFAFVFARPMLRSIGFAEQMMLVLLALSLVGMLTGRSMIKGLASCGIGLLLGTIGAAVATAEFRMTLDTLYLADGVPLLVVALGLFAVPEILDVLRRQATISERAIIGVGWLSGIRDVLRHHWLVLRCAAIGSLVGALPGLGGTVIDWIAYAHGMQSAKDKSQFGKGDIRGVIAPESANNAKEGGALIPTLFLGIPGSGTMALLLGGLILIGVTPGRTLVNDRADLVYLIIWSIALANIFGALICMTLARPIARLTRAPYALIAPGMLVMISFAAMQTSQSWGDLAMLAAFGLLGVFMKRFGWSRPALLIGFVLAPSLEDSVSRTVQIYGLDVFERPLAMGILALTVGSALIAWRVRSGASMGEAAATAASAARRGPQLGFAAALLGFAVFAIVDTSDLRFLAYLFPVSVAVVTGLLILASMARMMLAHEGGGALYDMEAENRAEGGAGAPMSFYFAWFLALPLLSATLGFLPGAAVFVVAFLRMLAGRGWALSLAGGAAAIVGLWGLATMLSLRYPESLVERLAAHLGLFG